MRHTFDTSKYIGIPYVSKGRDWSGVDCWGLVRLVYHTEYGLNLLSFTDYYEDANRGDQVKQVIQDGKSLLNSVQRDSPEYGDIAVFNMRGVPCHVGIYIGQERILHVLRGTDSVIERLSSYRLKGRLEGYYGI